MSSVDKERYVYTDITFKATKSSYATSPTTNYNLIFCINPPKYDKFAIAAMSKSGNTYYISDTSDVQEYSGPWGNTQENDSGTPCGNISTDLTGNLRGYAAEDTSTGPWREWAGGN